VGTSEYYVKQQLMSFLPRDLARSSSYVMHALARSCRIFCHVRTLSNVTIRARGLPTIIWQDFAKTSINLPRCTEGWEPPPPPWSRCPPDSYRQLLSYRIIRPASDAVDMALMQRHRAAFKLESICERVVAEMSAARPIRVNPRGRRAAG
jgi:hypothetical protein